MFLKPCFCFVFFCFISIYFLLYIVFCDQNVHSNKSENEIFVTKPIINAAFELSMTDHNSVESSNFTNDNKDINYKVVCKDDCTSEVTGSDTEAKLTSLVIKKETEFEEDIEDDDENALEENCDGKLSSFVRNIEATSFLPDDYNIVKDSLNFNKEDNNTIYEQINNINDTLQLIHRLLKYGQKLRFNVDIIDTIKYMSSITIDEVYEAKISSECTADLLHVVQAIVNNELWAWNFPDSFGSLHLSGFLQGQISSFGEFQNCLTIKSPLLNSNRHIYGRYCQLQFQSLLPPLKKYHPQFETEFRSSETFTSLERLSKRLNIDKYMSKKMKFVKFASEFDRLHGSKYLRYGVCFPHTCTSVDISRLLNRIFYPITKIPIKVDQDLCDVHEEIKTAKNLDAFQIIAKYFFITLFIAVFSATFYEIYLLNCENESNNNSPRILLNQQSVHPEQLPFSKLVHHSTAAQIFLSFGAIRNSQILGCIDNRYAPLDTARFLLVFVISSINSIFVAVILTPQLFRNMTTTVPFEILYQKAYWFARIPGFWCDCFIFTVGVMIVFQQFNLLKQNEGKFNYFTFLLKPWLHLCVLMTGAMMTIYLLPLFGSGPLWHITDNILAVSCKQVNKLAPSFLMYSNWIGPLTDYQVGITCNPSSWLFSIIAQMYCFTPIVFLSLYFCPGFAMVLVTTILFFSPILILSPRLFFDLPPFVELTKLYTLTDFYRSFTFYQLNPLQYSTAMVSGLFTGYLIKKKTNLQMPGGRKMAIFVWWISFIILIGTILWHCSFWKINTIVSSNSVMAWFVISKIVCLFWLSYTGYLCCTGKSRTLNTLLTFRWMQPIAKLSNSIYLLRSLTIFKRFSSKHTYEIEYWQTFQNLVIDFWITVFLAYVIYILLEAPFIRIAQTVTNISTNAKKYQHNLIPGTIKNNNITQV